MFEFVAIKTKQNIKFKFDKVNAFIGHCCTPASVSFSSLCKHSSRAQQTSVLKPLFQGFIISTLTKTAINVTYLSLTGCQGRFPLFPMPRSGHTATILFKMRDIVSYVITAASRQQMLEKRRKWQVLVPLPVSRQLTIVSLHYCHLMELKGNSTLNKNCNIISVA